MEGVAGILNHDDWVRPSGMFYEKGMRLLTEEVNAAVEGFISAGVHEVLVVDGHGPGGIDPETLHEKAALLRGGGGVWGLDSSFDGLAFVGQHAKAGTPFSHITHTGWFDCIDYRINDVSIGEYGQLALCAMELNVPTILACGEEALCKEAEALTPGVVTVSGKRGLSPDGFDDLDADEYRKAKLSAVHKSPRLVRGLIREGAARAVQELKRDPGRFKYPVLKPEFTRKIRFRKYGDRPACETFDIHPSSIIDLMSLPVSKPD